MKPGLEIFQVKPGSIAGELGLAPGDRVVAINGEQIRDLLDFRFLQAEENLIIDIKKAGGEEWVLDVEKDYDQVLGIGFGDAGFGRIRRCNNKCLFCFVDQMPAGMRKTLYVKDDDYRLSFWSGSFITLTNLDDNDLQRIAGQRMSPLYISVHTTNPELRVRMLGNDKAGLILEQLRYLAGAGIEMHTQVVLCPGLNDGVEIKRTVADLVDLWPAVSSLAVVPVGLTRFRRDCYHLRAVNADEAREMVRWVHLMQDEFTVKMNYPFVFASDEFYLMSGEPLPLADRYVDFPQTENGVGLTRLFLDEWQEIEKILPAGAKDLKATIVTGRLGEKVLGPVAARLNRIKGLEVHVKVIDNHFFGEQVTVTGLVTGKDILSQLKREEIGDLLVIPAVMLKKGEHVFLDDLALEELTGRLGKKVAVAEGPCQLVEVLYGGCKK